MIRPSRWVAERRVAGDQLSGVSYADEVALVRSKLDREGRISLKEMVFLLHARLMADLRSWADANRVESVDAIGALDREGGSLRTAQLGSPQCPR